ncbi:MAG: LacI family DNA-binding transcriptional regulator [Eubacteriales bacterium]|nr:LacI family DNA-binding transcriptional regulator [Eubacteriales bacterium]
MTNNERSLHAVVTLRDVAEMAQVSVSTVSYVLNGKKTVRPETLTKINAAIKELGYYPNQIAIGLKTKRTYTIGVILPDISNSFYADIIKGIEDTVHLSGYSVILCNTENDEAREMKYLNTLLGKDIDGLVFIGTGKTRDISGKFGSKPVVLVDRKFGNEFSSVSVNNILGGYLATKLLLKDSRDIIFLSGPVSVNTISERKIGYRNALAEACVAFNENNVIECDFTYDGGYNAITGILKEGRKIQAVFASNDEIALGAMRAMIENGIKIPDDVKIAGYDDIRLAAMYNPALTTIRQPKYEMGKKAGELILDMIVNKDGETRQVVLEPVLVERETT